jgi:hypothetical protein
MVACTAGAQTPTAPVWSEGSNYPDLSAAPAQDVADADRLWRRSKRVARRLFPTVAAARRLGYKGNVHKVKRPKPFFFHLRNTPYTDDGRVLDPRRPEAVVYWYDPPRPMVLVGFMFRVPQDEEPALARSVLPWHAHCNMGSVITHTWFTNDLRSGVAREPPRPEFAAAFDRDFADPTPDSASCGPVPPHTAPHDEAGVR